MEILDSSAIYAILFTIVVLALGAINAVVKARNNGEFYNHKNKRKNGNKKRL